MLNLLITLGGKGLSKISQIFNFGSGSTWPGHIALNLNKKYIQQILAKSPTQIILIVGTNGKTTTGRMLTAILQANLPAGKAGKKKVFQNSSGANLLNGIASSLLTHTNLFGKLTAEYAIFEIDENNLASILAILTPKMIIALDLFRDQLDRYGELDSIAKKWQLALTALPASTSLILNADDPLIAYLGNQTHTAVSYFGLDSQQESSHPMQHAADSLYCPRCSTKLSFQKIFYSHLGIWKCPHCQLTRHVPTISTTFYPLDGTYNKYNALAATLAALSLGIPQENIDKALRTVTPAFGRQEKLQVNGKTVQIFLAKNPTSFNEVLHTIDEKKAKHVMFILNDRIPDGLDISWIWDIDFEPYIDTFKSITISGDRVYDMALRIHYSMKFQKNAKYKILNTKYFIDPNLKLALQTAIHQAPLHETLYILPTYSAMLEVRKILTGKKIL